MMKRRHFLKTTALATAGLTCRAEIQANEDASDPVIDIHQHVNYHLRDNDVFLEHQKAMRIRKTILLPAGTPMNRPSTHLGKSNGLAADVSGTQEAADFVAKYPDSYAFFSNEVPDEVDAVKKMEYWLERGAIGIGESKFQLEIDSPPMLQMYEVARAQRAGADAFPVPNLQSGIRALRENPGQVSHGQLHRSCADVVGEYQCRS